MYKNPIPRINFTGAFKVQGAIITLRPHKDAI